MYETFQSVLLDDDKIWKRKYSTSERIVWGVPNGSSGAFTHWSSDFYREKQRLERDICRLKWHKSQVKEHADMPSKFVKKYNFLFDLLKEVEGRCYISTSSSVLVGEEAETFVDCVRKNRVERNSKSRELASYKRLRKRYEEIAESLGISYQFKK